MDSPLADRGRVYCAFGAFQAAAMWEKLEGLKDSFFSRLLTYPSCFKQHLRMTEKLSAWILVGEDKYDAVVLNTEPWPNGRALPECRRCLARRDRETPQKKAKPERVNVTNAPHHRALIRLVFLTLVCCMSLLFVNKDQAYLEVAAWSRDTLSRKWHGFLVVLHSCVPIYAEDANYICYLCNWTPSWERIFLNFALQPSHLVARSAFALFLSLLCSGMFVYDKYCTLTGPNCCFAEVNAHTIMTQRWKG